MLNSIEAYQKAGKKAAVAMNQKDVDTYNFHKRWFSSAVGLEKDEFKEKARKAYDEAYAAARAVPRPTLY